MQSIKEIRQKGKIARGYSSSYPQNKDKEKKVNWNPKVQGRFVRRKLGKGSIMVDPFKEETMNETAAAAIKKKADKSGMPAGILKKVYDRGVAAWRTGHRPGTTPQQWGLARVNSFVTKSSGTWGKADSDLASKVKG